MNIVKNIVLTLIVTTPLVQAAHHGKELTAHRAAQTNDVAALRALIEQTPDVLLKQEPDQFGHTALICAINKGNQAAVDCILACPQGKQTVHTKSHRGKSPLAYACDRNSAPIAIALLEAKADPDETTAQGERIITRAVKKGLSVAKQLVLYGANEDESSLTRLTHGNPNARSVLLIAYCQRQRLENRRLQQQLRCAEEMLAQERERYQLAAGAFCEQEHSRTKLYKANKILGTKLLESQRKLTTASREINAYKAEKQNFEQEKSELQQKLSESQDSLERTQADLVAAELKSDDEDERDQLARENATLRAELETARHVTSTLEVVLPEVAEGWEFVLDGSPVEE